MKKTLKLIPALAMLLVSAILVSTSTYAWFSMNATVTAKGMQVTATAESSLNIKVLAADNNTYGSEATVTMGASLKLKPTSTSDLTKFFKATAANYNEYAAIASTVEVVNADPINYTAQSTDQGYFILSDGLGYVTTTATGVAPISAGTTSGDAYALVAGYNIKLTDGAANKGLAIPTIKVGGLTAALSNSIRVGVIMVDGNSNAGTPKIIAPSRTSLTGAGSPYSSTSATANPNPTVVATDFNATDIL